MAATNWEEVTEFFNGVIEEATEPIVDSSNDLIVGVYSPALDEVLRVVIPRRSVEDFMKNLPLYEAVVTKDVSRGDSPRTAGYSGLYS